MNDYIDTKGIVDEHNLGHRFEPVGTYRDPATIPPRKWLYSKQYILGHVSATIADGGVGKTNLSIAEGIALATGRNILGVDVPEPTNVLYWNGEEPLDEIERRIHAVCLRYGIDPTTELTNRFFMMSGLEPKHSILLATMQRGTLIFDEACIAGIEEVVTWLKIGLLILDPFVSLHRIPEGDNTNIEAVVGRLAVVANRCRIAIDIDHHVRKQQGHFGEVTVADARGATALVNKARTARVLNRMTPTQAQSAKVADHREYIRSDNGKANYAPPFAATWFKIVSIPLPNGDNVGALEPWKHPGAFDAVRPEHIDAVRATIRSNDNYRADPQSPQWVGYVIAQVTGLDARVDADRESIKKIIKTWIENAVLFKVPRKDETRRYRTYIAADPPPESKQGEPLEDNVVPVDFGKQRKAKVPDKANGQEKTENDAPTIASVPFMLTLAQKRELQALGCSDKQIYHMTPEEGQNVLVQRRNLARLLPAWYATIGVLEPRTVEQVIAAADGAVADDDKADRKLKRALAAVAPQDNGPDEVDSRRLEDWLRSVSGVEVGHLMVHGDGVNEKGAPLWTLELRVAPDRGSPSN
jgi:hypothetical protein